MTTFAQKLRFRLDGERIARLARVCAVRGVPEAAIPAVTAVAFGLSAFVSIYATKNSADVAAIWPANGLAAAALLTDKGRPALYRAPQ